MKLVWSSQMLQTKVVFADQYRRACCFSNAFNSNTKVTVQISTFASTHAILTITFFNLNALRTKEGALSVEFVPLDWLIQDKFSSRQ